MYSLVSAVKASCAVRLECLGASYRFMWHGGRWIQSPVEFPSSKKEESHVMPRANHRMARSNTSASLAPEAKRHPRARDDSDLVRHSMTQDDRSRRLNSTNLYKPQSYYSSAGVSFYKDAMVAEQKIPLSPTIGAIPGKEVSGFFFQAPELSSTSSTTFVLSASDSCNGFGLLEGSNKRMLDDLAFQYKEGGEIFKLAHGKFMGCFGKYIRLENRSVGWELRERAFVLEEDLEQEMKDMEGGLLGSQWIDQF